MATKPWTLRFYNAEREEIDWERQVVTSDCRLHGRCVVTGENGDMADGFVGIEMFAPRYTWAGPVRLKKKSRQC